MPKINVLPKQIAELIAAGEVVERPASVIKELVENSIDAEATDITVEINKGGISYIRITDNGCGIEHSDVPTAFLRHATSKIITGNDLNSIATLGFRGEALAAISSVARVEVFTKTRANELGTHYIIEGGDEILYEEAGCPDGTTVIIRDIFFNTPARMKFLKKDVSEANAAAAVVERIALSHPEIAFRFIRDGKQTLNTQGNNDKNGTVYSVLGREFAGTLIEVSGEYERIGVTGLTCKPVSCRPTRNYQFTFLNGRLVRSGTVVAAVEQAYKNSAMVGKFPAFVLYLTVPFDTVDVNVHPAKTEVRFSDERRVFDAVYGAVKNALVKGDTRPEVKFKAPAFNPFERMKTEEYRQQVIKTESTIAEKVYTKNVGLHKAENIAVLKQNPKPDFFERYSVVGPNGEKVKPQDIPQKLPVIEKRPEPETVIIKTEEAPKEVNITTETEETTPEINVIGQAFSTYIIAEMGDSVFMIDKHAAHERILYNELKSNIKTEVQALLTPVTVTLAREEYSAVLSNTETIAEAGFEIEDFGNSAVRVCSIPATLIGEDIASLIGEIAEKLLKSAAVENKRLDDIYHTVACKAAIKAGSKTSFTEMQNLAERVLSNKNIMYCPHGRPVAFEIKRRELEKQFGRIQ